MNRTLKSASLLISTVIVLTGLSLSPTPSEANPTPSRQRSFQISQSFKPPSRGTAPPTAGSATRSGTLGNSCLTSGKQLTSLMPQTRLGLSYSGNPTFYWYVPPSSAKTAKFILLSNDDADVHYETTLNLPKTSGIVSFALPSTVPPLEVGKQYHWYLVVSCNENDQIANPSLEGWVERVEPTPDLSSQLQKADFKSRARIYAENGIWYEAVTTLATLRQTNPKDAATIAGWNELLKSVNLDAIAAEPLYQATLSQN
ncbi:MAG: DUF928 domain-containing protein [Leptolyngbyaceae cyanobacterium bins.302]|nr:DUF928 domain-containing protein [Leptolyngbyaceae cyanobacterium bins.302]